VHCQDFSGRSLQFDSRFVKLLWRLTPTALLTGFATSFVDQDASHRLGGSAKKVSPAMPLLSIRPGQLQPGFMDESSRLQRLSRCFVRHAGRREFAQFVINEGEQLLGCIRIALFDRF